MYVYLPTTTFTIKKYQPNLGTVNVSYMHPMGFKDQRLCLVHWTSRVVHIFKKQAAQTSEMLRIRFPPLLNHFFGRFLLEGFGDFC